MLVESVSDADIRKYEMFAQTLAQSRGSLTSNFEWADQGQQGNSGNSSSSSTSTTTNANQSNFQTNEGDDDLYNE